MLGSVGAGAGADAGYRNSENPKIWGFGCESANIKLLKIYIIYIIQEFAY